MKNYILALDQGTTSSRCIIFNLQGDNLVMEQKEFPQHFPNDGWVEHDPMDIWNSQLEVARTAIAKLGISPKDIAAIGITNQRETTIVWEKETGRPIYNAIVWQCRRTAEYCDYLKADGKGPEIKSKTGLLIDAYFSATKIKWILDHVPDARERAKRGELMFGTVDSWLIYNLTGKKVHATDYSNASRTLLFNINTLEWDESLLKIFHVPGSMMPQVLPSSGFFGMTDPSLFGAEIPITGVAGDQQAALFGQCCFQPGNAKNTYGTGGFMLMNTGKKPVFSHSGLVTTIAWGIGDDITYAMEGSVFICGAVVQWLRDGLHLIHTASETESIASTVEDTDGVYFVPAFVGLGAPYWDPYARGTILGITRGTTYAHLVRAALESMAYQTADVLAVMRKESGSEMTSLRVDGGASANNLLLQFQSDIMDTPIIRPKCIETTAFGAAALAALGAGCYKSTDEIMSNWQIERRFTPQMSQMVRDEKIREWHKAIRACSGWAQHDLI
ncbi:MAG: glycerol kinase GlpK [Clostridia bacterium]|nr:glycerol kinase GlpK [Clostridia bacterium]